MAASTVAVNAIDGLRSSLGGRLLASASFVAAVNDICGGGIVFGDAIRIRCSDEKSVLCTLWPCVEEYVIFDAVHIYIACSAKAALFELPSSLSPCDVSPLMMIPTSSTASNTATCIEDCSNDIEPLSKKAAKKKRQRMLAALRTEAASATSLLPSIPTASFLSIKILVTPTTKHSFDDIKRRIRRLIHGQPIERGCFIIDQLSDSDDDNSVVIAEVDICEVDESRNATAIVDISLTTITYIQSCLDVVLEEKDVNVPTVMSSELVGSLDRAVNELVDLLRLPFQHPNAFSLLGVECPRGILFHGAPGSGKTTAVREAARRCNASLHVLNGPDVFSGFVGDSERNLRCAFEDAVAVTKSNSCPVILFIDEIDALCSKRDKSALHEARVVGQLLTLMDGFSAVESSAESPPRLVVVGATNRPNTLDPALRRPGRFDREIAFSALTLADRTAVLRLRTSRMSLAPNVDLAGIASRCQGCVGADLNAICREAAFSAVRRYSDTMNDNGIVIDTDFESALIAVSPSTLRGATLDVEKVLWSHIGGLEKVKTCLRQAVEWPLRYCASFKRLGISRPRGILLYGPPGCSKTTLVKAVATAAHSAFLSLSGAEIYSPFVGDAEKTVRDLFRRARASTPCVIFFDEIDALVGKRSSGDQTGDEVQSRLLATLLNEMDGVEASDGVLVAGATNRPDMLDAALLRPGRFDQLLYVPPPDAPSRRAILRIHMDDRVDKSTSASSYGDVNETLIDWLVKVTDNFTGADIQRLCREAAMAALRRNIQATSIDEVDYRSALLVCQSSLSRDPTQMAYYEELNSRWGA